ncbi:exopolysaccharide production protein ExoY [Yoonia maricola]|uniref:Exopolysaccharide production protein ExoY n=1 Tax=Yoonia maricola TaxID=420999 RepID=A0A2M8WKM3_9RHOB|nr:sugar transferase [Yoonia maricola]PJI91458.1 exopolysaccharide production protein ExoY [Yoonia maricola]
MPTMESVGFAAFDEKRVNVSLNDTNPLTSDHAVGGILKRAVDIIIASTALLMLAPLFVMVAIAVKLAAPGPALYGHSRVGYQGRTFRCWKFRSMVTDGDRVLQEYLTQNPQERDTWERDRKLRNDPRVTRIGAVLRAYSVDELPQLINVLFGDMSIVGPRPVVDDELAMYGTAAPIYLSARPGITGLWQVSGRSDTSYEQRVSFDTTYVQGWSLVSDISIILRTIPAVVSSRGSY